jgi:hypothetical protein
MRSIDPVIQLLEAALRPGANLEASIKRAQEMVWDHGASEPEPEAWAILRDLAHDLDFFVADEKARAEDPSYFGEDRARAEIRGALDRLRSRQAT